MIPQTCSKLELVASAPASAVWAAVSSEGLWDSVCAVGRPRPVSHQRPALGPMCREKARILEGLLSGEMETSTDKKIQSF